MGVYVYMLGKPEQSFIVLDKKGRSFLIAPLVYAYKPYWTDQYDYVTKRYVTARTVNDKLHESIVGPVARAWRDSGRCPDLVYMATGNEQHEPRDGYEVRTWRNRTYSCHDQPFPFKVRGVLARGENDIWTVREEA
jgi:hypothetical protein